MIITTQNYKDAVQSGSRRDYVVAKFGLFDKKAKGAVSNIVADKQPFNDLNGLIDESLSSFRKYVSCEEDRVLLDGSFYFVYDKTQPNAQQTIPFWSEFFSLADGTFTVNPKITMEFSIDVNLIPITIHCEELVDSVTVRYYLDTVLQDTCVITGNTSITIETTINTIGAFDTLEIEFVKTGTPERYVKVQEIDLGYVRTFGKNEIADFSMTDSLDLFSNTMQSNQLHLTVENPNKLYSLRNPSSEMNYLQERQQMTLYYYVLVNGQYQELPLGTFLIKEFNAPGSYLQFSAYDERYFMNKIYYGSKFYENVPLNTVLLDLFDYFNYTNYVIESNSVTLSGYIPRVDFREALRMICEASKFVAKIDRYGVLTLFDYVNITETPDYIIQPRLISADNPKKSMYNNVIDVSQYKYNVYLDKIVYTAVLDPGTYDILFDEYPAVNLDASNSVATVTINHSYATGANITVTVGGLVEIEARVYTNDKITHRIIKNPTLESTDYAVQSVDNTLITTQFNDIALWKLSGSEIKNYIDMVNLPFLEVGDLVQFEDDEGIEVKTRISRMEFKNSMFIKIEGE